MTHAPTVRRLFALEHAFRPRPPMPLDLPRRVMPGHGEITLITGPSGGGKSSLLAALRDHARDGAREHSGKSDIDRDRVPQIIWIEPAALRLPDACVIDCLCQALSGESFDRSDKVIELALELLGRVGLAEAWTYLQKPSELSDGQRWRLMLAIGIATAQRRAASLNGENRPAVVTAIIAMDEFAALLDRITARVVARSLRRLIRPGGNTTANESMSSNLSAIVATSHDDLADALMPDKTVVCDFDSYAITPPPTTDAAEDSKSTSARNVCTPTTPSAPPECRRTPEVCPTAVSHV